ncbi:stimulated by retinoic acid gene 6 protein-like isoform X2 [Stylophora pistillata]|uniref:stimulated by retinoic acid gene 6 protein-like isoform X2 n=1 Tax=Stylophora pistillata TaxID=50429 RepID=UPI000C045EBF|nr:stimulated by retinoic acid gene 6 protein-like isoform X2 [Stylophora pistillata]
MADSSAKNTSQGCSTVIKGIWFDLGCLGPALVIILILAFLKRRVKFKLQNCIGYPGLLVPINFLGGFSNRYTIAVTFGATASTCLRMFLKPKYGIFQMPDPAGWVQVFQNIVTVLVYGILFYPFFACLTTENRLVGSSLGFLYVTIRFSFKLAIEFQCVKQYEEKYQKEFFSMANLGRVPTNFCLAFIWIRFGVLLYREVRKKWSSSTTRSGDEICVTRLAREAEIAHITELLNPGSIWEDTVERNWFSRQLRRFYKPRKDFKFSPQFISTTLVSALMIFQVFMALLSFLNVIRRVFIQFYKNNGNSSLGNVYDVFFGVIEAGVVVPAIFSLLMLLHFMKCHREHVLQLYRGQATFSQDLLLTPANSVGKSLRFSGYQIAYTLIEILGEELWKRLKDSGITLLPTLALIISLMLFQLFLTRIVFRDSTYPNITVTIDNRRLFSIMSYFFFFYNIILGLFSGFMRILKGMLLGVIFISRIDRTSLMQGFQAWDKAFVAYLGFVTVLVAHRHPVMLVFCQLLIDRRKGHQPLQQRSATKPVYRRFGAGTERSEGFCREYRQPRMSQKAVNRWLLALTLLRNPSLIKYRCQGHHVTATVVTLGSVKFDVPV